MIRLVLFDFGGVIAEEGFRKGFMALAEKHDIDPQELFSTGRDLVLKT